MTTQGPLVLCITRSAALHNDLRRRLARQASACVVQMATGLPQARARLRARAPDVIVLDAVVLGALPVTPLVRELARCAPVVFLADVDCQDNVMPLADLFAQGRLELIWRVGNWVAPLAEAVQRQLDRARPGSGEPGGARVESLEEFGEILRHEVNNPLTGILGNAELLLARRESLPVPVVQRLETIAELAVRLRETIRQLSDVLESRAGRLRSA